MVNKSEFVVTLFDTMGRIQKAQINRRFQFPGGEYHFEFGGVDLFIPSKIRIHAQIHNGDIMELSLLTDAVRRFYPGIEVHLDLPYIPYARQDRVAVKGESLALKVFCDAVNSLGFKTVTVFDPHSLVAPALINNVIVKEIESGDLFMVIQDETHLINAVVVCPDNGARKRSEHFRGISPELSANQLVFCDKKRDPISGVLSGYYVINPTDIPSQVDGPINFFVYDDICDGGGTFMLLATAIKEHMGSRPYNLHLIVSHGIFSKGKEVLLNEYTTVGAIYEWI